MDKGKTARLVISDMATSSINKKLIRLSKIEWKAVEGSICFVRTHVRNDVTFWLRDRLSRLTGPSGLLRDTE